MRTAVALLAFAVSLPGGSSAADDKTTIARTQFRGGTAWRISDGATEAVIVPAYDGRLMSYGKVGSANWLWNGQPDEDGEHMRWGGDKTFPGPHSQYPEGTNGAGLSVEYYHHNLPPPRQYFELELLSPLRPSCEGAAFTTRWSLHAVRGQSPADAASRILATGK